MAMHRQDYYLIANALAKCKSLGQDNLLYVADMLATDMEKADPTFKRGLFLEVSGVKSKQQQALESLHKLFKDRPVMLIELAAEGIYVDLDKLKKLAGVEQKNA